MSIEKKEEINNKPKAETFDDLIDSDLGILVIEDLLEEAIEEYKSNKLKPF